MIPVIKFTNVTYESQSPVPPTPGVYGLLMISQSSDSPTVPMIDRIFFPVLDDAYGAENQILEIFESIPITSTSQLVAVGEYNEPIVAGRSGNLIEMEAGFAEEYFI